MSAGKLTHIACKNAKYNPEGTGNYLSDGGGLNLIIKEGDKKSRT